MLIDSRADRAEAVNIKTDAEPRSEYISFVLTVKIIGQIAVYSSLVGRTRWMLIIA
jgi:hypothetical protein